MKAEQKIKAKMANGIRTCLDNLRSLVEFQLSGLMKAETVEEVMEIKQKILLSWVDFMPLSASSCYFCMFHDNCTECEYAKIHGPCFEGSSDFRRIANAQRLFRRFIKEKYYGGEKY